MYVFRVPNQRKEVKRWGQYVKIQWIEFSRTDGRHQFTDSGSTINLNQDK